MRRLLKWPAPEAAIMVGNSPQRPIFGGGEQLGHLGLIGIEHRSEGHGFRYRNRLLVATEGLERRKLKRGLSMAVIHRISHAPEPAFNRRSLLGMPAIIGDEMPPTQNMVDGKHYTSKAAMRATYRPSGNAEGARFGEVGNDPAMFRRPSKPKPDRAAVKAAVGRAFSRAGLGA